MGIEGGSPEVEHLPNYLKELEDLGLSDSTVSTLGFIAEMREPISGLALEAGGFELVLYGKKINKGQDVLQAMKKGGLGNLPGGFGGYFYEEGAGSVDLLVYVAEYVFRPEAQRAVQIPLDHIKEATELISADEQKSYGKIKKPTPFQVDEHSETEKLSKAIIAKIAKKGD